MKKLILISIVFISFKTEAQTSVLSVADSLYTMGNYTKAIETYKQHPVKEEVFESIAKAYVALGNYDEALLYYDRALNGDKENTLLKYDYAKLLSRMKQYDKAAAFFSELIDKDYKNPNFHYELGLVLEKTPDTLGKAQNRFFSAYELDNTHQKAIYKIAKYHLQKRHHEQVDKYVDQGLKSYANNKELISLKAQNFYWQEDYKNAVIWFKKLINLGESSQFIQEKLSFSYVRLYEYEDALIHAKQALKFDPNNTTNLYVIGQIYERMEDFVNAETYFKMYLELQDVPLDTEYAKLAFVLNRQEKYGEAIKMYQKAIKEDPSRVENRFFLVMAKAKYYKDIDAKIKVHEDFIAKYPENPYAQFSQKMVSDLKKEKFMQKE